jgi:RNA polymerase-binding transcription factor DksA
MLTQEQISHFKEKLLAEKLRLEGDLSRIATKSDSGSYETNFQNLGSDEDESAAEVEEYVDALGVESNLETQLREVEAALDRIEKGTYGICENTGKPIALERLEAYPSARVAL